MKFKKTPINKLTLFGVVLTISLMLISSVIVTKTLATANYGTAVAGNILNGETATVGTGQIVTGNIANMGAYNSSLSNAVAGGTLYTRIPQGAYLTNTVSGYPEITSSVPDLVSSNILGGKNILGVAGSIPILSANWQTGAYRGTYNGGASGYGVLTQIPQGYSDGGTNTYSLVFDSNFIASNIKSGSSIFGLSGTFQGVIPTHGSQAWTTPGTYYWAVPAGVSGILGMVTGGGGGGGYGNYGWSTVNPGCGGGGGGGTNINMINVTPGQVVTITVGGGGGITVGVGSGNSYEALGITGGTSSIDGFAAYGGGGGGAHGAWGGQAAASGGSGGGYGGYGATGTLSAYGPAYGGGGLAGYGNGGYGYYAAGSSSAGSAGRVVIQW